jgi:hypothetical protein
MLSTDQIERIQRYSVESQRHRYTNEQLWARLVELNRRELEILELIPLAYRLAFSWRAGHQFWRREWNRLLNESSANRPLIDCLIWHLKRRGDNGISGWLADNEERTRELASSAQRAAWRLNCD